MARPHRPSLSRRSTVRLSVLAGVLALAAGCASPPPPTGTTPPPPSSPASPVLATVICNVESPPCAEVQSAVEEALPRGHAVVREFEYVGGFVCPEDLGCPFAPIPGMTFAGHVKLLLSDGASVFANVYAQGGTTLVKIVAPVRNTVPSSGG